MAEFLQLKKTFIQSATKDADKGESLELQQIFHRAVAKPDLARFLEPEKILARAAAKDADMASDAHETARRD
jgi:hypothetical protein